MIIVFWLFFNCSSPLKLGETPSPSPVKMSRTKPNSPGFFERSANSIGWVKLEDMFDLTKKVKGIFFCWRLDCDKLCAMCLNCDPLTCIIYCFKKLFLLVFSYVLPKTNFHVNICLILGNKVFVFVFLISQELKAYFF